MDACSPPCPIAAWELSVGFYMTFKGFKRTPFTATLAS